MASSPVYIYALVDPRTDEVRYIGQSMDPQRRFAAHLKDGARCPQNARRQWLAALAAQGLHPVLQILEASDSLAWHEAERRHIAAALAQGNRLTNLTSGGRGAQGVKREKGLKHRGGRPRMVKILVELEDAQADWLRAESGRRGLPLAEIVRYILYRANSL